MDCFVIAFKALCFSCMTDLCSNVLLSLGFNRLIWVMFAFWFNKPMGKHSRNNQAQIICVAAFCNETFKGFERSVKRHWFSHPLHPRKPFRDLLEDVARQLPRDVGEKTAWESTGQLASVLKKLNAQSLHPRLGTRLNNALLQADGVDHRDAVGGLGFGFV